MAIISGKEISNKIREKLKNEVVQLKNQGVFPCLAVILVGNDPASEIYVRNKKKTCGNIGIVSLEHHLSEKTSQEELNTLIRSLNFDPKVNGILCQFPLPPELNEEQVIQLIDQSKDVDGLHPGNIGYLSSGKSPFIPCTPLGIHQILKDIQCEISGKHVVVLGRSNLVGRPISILLSQKGIDATVTLCHSRTRDLPLITSQADILIVAIGKPEFVTADMVKKDAVVIDVGTNRIDDPSHPKGSRLVGDVKFSEVEPKSSAITPVPGGVGPMTITMLMYNTVKAARIQNQLEPMPW